MKRLLLVTYYYPPLAGSGVFRPLRMSRYLPRNGWEVTVLTVSDRARTLKDPALVAEIPEEVRIERTRSLEPRSLFLVLNRLGLRAWTGRLEPYFMIPDDQRGWVPFAVRRGLRLHREGPFDAVVSTAGPYSAHLVGRALKRRCGVGWVADFRDEWSTNPYLEKRYPTDWHRRLNRRLETSVLREASAVVCVSGPWLDTLRGLVPEQPVSKFEVHPNGYDPWHFRGNDPGAPTIFRVAYTGTFYGHRSPRAFMQGVARAIQDGRIPADAIEVVLVGHSDPAMMKDVIPTARVRALDHRPFHETIRLLRDAAVLLLVIPTEGGPGNHTGKLFNYLAARRPILALSPEPNVAADLIRASRSGRVVPPDDPRAVADALAGLYAEWKSGRGLLDQDREMIAAYDAAGQARRYAALLDRVSGRDLAGG